MSVDLSLVQKYAPAVYFHENESYFPCSIEYMLQGATLMEYVTGTDGQTTTQTIKENPTTEDLYNYYQEDYFISINSSQYCGMQVGAAPMYFAWEEYEDAVKISYIFLYAYQGGQTCEALRIGTEFDCIINTVGQHQGDLERIVVTLRKIKKRESPRATSYSV